jgi:hypothetical protein
VLHGDHLSGADVLDVEIAVAVAVDDKGERLPVLGNGERLGVGVSSARKRRSPVEDPAGPG